MYTASEEVLVSLTISEIDGVSAFVTEDLQNRNSPAFIAFETNLANAVSIIENHIVKTRIPYFEDLKNRRTKTTKCRKDELNFSRGSEPIPI